MLSQQLYVLNYQLFTNLLHPRAVRYQAHCWQHRRHC